MKFLHFCSRGENFVVNEKGEIARYHCFTPQPFSPTWIFQGVSTHHWHNHIVFTLDELFEHPEMGVNGYVWDLDHGTTRRWGGTNPRITSCYVKKTQI